LGDEKAELEAQLIEAKNAVHKGRQSLSPVRHLRDEAPPSTNALDVTLDNIDTSAATAGQLLWSVDETLGAAAAASAKEALEERIADLNAVIEGKSVQLELESQRNDRLQQDFLQVWQDLQNAHKEIASLRSKLGKSEEQALSKKNTLFAQKIWRWRMATKSSPFLCANRRVSWRLPQTLTLRGMVVPKEINFFFLRTLVQRKWLDNDEGQEPLPAAKPKSRMTTFSIDQMQALSSSSAPRLVKPLSQQALSDAFGGDADDFGDFGPNQSDSESHFGAEKSAATPVAKSVKLDLSKWCESPEPAASQPRKQKYGTVKTLHHSDFVICNAVARS